MMYHSEPNRAEPSRWAWFSVETPRVVREYKLPACDLNWTRDDKRKHAELTKLAERHGTAIRVSACRRD
jgi:hypothetical protein